MELIKYTNGKGEGLRLTREERRALERALLLVTPNIRAEVKTEDGWEIAVEIDE